MELLAFPTGPFGIIYFYRGKAGGFWFERKLKEEHDYLCYLFIESPVSGFIAVVVIK